MKRFEQFDGPKSALNLTPNASPRVCNIMSKPFYERPVVVIPLLAAGVIILLSGCWNAPFNLVDDGLTLYQMLRKSTHDLVVPSTGKHFMPVTDISLAADCFFLPQPTAQVLKSVSEGKGGEFDVNMPGASHFRLMNGVYHFIAAIFLWIFCSRLCAALGIHSGVAFFIAIVWTLHPMNCESVCWIAERKSTLAALFGFGALALWTVDPARWWRWPLVYVVFLLALLSKLGAVVLLPVFFGLEILDPFQHQFNARDRSAWLKVLLRCLPFLILGFVFSRIGLIVYMRDTSDPMPGGLPTILLTDVWLMARYLEHLLIPTGLSFVYYIEPVTSLADGRFWAGLLALAVFGSLILLTERSKRPIAVFGLLWFAAGLAPFMNFVPVWAPFQDRWVYFGMPGFLLALALAFCGVVQHRERVRPALPYVFGGLLLLVCWCSFRQSTVYATNETLIADTAARETHSGYAQLLAAETSAIQFRKSMEAGRTNEAAEWGKGALNYYSRALEGPDVEYFRDKLEIRARMAEILIGLRDYDRARAVLGGWLPPPGRTMVRPTPENPNMLRSRTELKKTYTSAMLAHAWGLMAECSLQQANNRSLPLPAQMELATRALSEIEKAIEAGEHGDVFKARTLMLISYIEADMGHEEPAQKIFAEAQRVLRAVPESSPSAALAKQILTNAKPPKVAPPKN
jgi:hypothetical protein